MEPMRPVDLGRTTPPRPWWRRWGGVISCGITVVLVAVVRVTADFSLWGAACVGLAGRAVGRGPRGAPAGGRAVGDRSRPTSGCVVLTGRRFPGSEPRDGGRV